MNNLVFGKYIPIDSLMHRLDPRAKLIGLFLMIAAVFIPKSWWVFLVIALLLALALLLAKIGIKMIVEGVREEKGEAEPLHGGALMIQGIATSIDALSVGFTIAEYNFASALTESLIIGIVTFGICAAGIRLGKTIGIRLAGKASVFGGIILILIGLEIFITGIT